MNAQCDKNEEEIAQDLEDYADAFYDHLADLCSQKHQLDKEIGYRKNTIQKLKRAHSELQSEKEQLEKIIAQLKKTINEEEYIPWSFTIEFDEAKAEKHGYDINDLYDCVDENVQRYGLTRLAQGTWKANEQDKVESQCLALSLLSKQEWVMQNINSLTAYENSATPIDYIEIVKQHFPERVYS